MKKIPILLYHKIEDGPSKTNPSKLSISPSIFYRQMKFLYEKGYICITLEEYFRVFYNAKKKPRKVIVLTFDDGYKNNYEHAFPVLAKYGYKATIFLVSDYIGKSSHWEGEFGTSLMSWAEVTEMHKYGITFGSHTCDHHRLTAIDNEKAIEQISRSKAKIENMLDSKVNFFSYPYSISNQQIIELVQKSGYMAACGADRGNYGRFNMWRSECLSNDPLFLFHAKASGLYFFKFWLKSRIHYKERI